MIDKFYGWIVMALVATLTGCASPLPPPELPPATGLEGKYNLGDHSPSKKKAILSPPRGKLDLPSAIGHVITNHPDLKARWGEAKVYKYLALQAELWPNPTISGEVEEFGGRKEKEAFDGSEAGVSLAQPIPLGGRLDKARREVELKREIALWEYRFKIRDLISETCRAYIDVWADQERLRLAREREKLSLHIFNVATKRVNMGAASSLQQDQAKLELEESRLAGRRAEKKLATSRQALATLWGGGDQPSFDKVSPLPPISDSLVEWKEVLTQVSHHPRWSEWKLKEKQARAKVDLEEARSVPDLTVKARVAYLEEANSHAFTLGLAWPLPLWNRNQGNISAAEVRLQQVAYRRQSWHRGLVIQLARAHRNLAEAWEEATTIEKRLLPQAQVAYKKVVTGYRQGKFPFLQVLESQRTLYKLKFRNLEARYSLYRAEVELEHLLAQPLEKTTNKKTK